MMEMEYVIQTQNRTGDTVYYTGRTSVRSGVRHAICTQDILYAKHYKTKERAKSALECLRPMFQMGPYTYVGATETKIYKAD